MLHSQQKAYFEKLQSEKAQDDIRERTVLDSYFDREKEGAPLAHLKLSKYDQLGIAPSELLLENKFY